MSSFGFGTCFKCSTILNIPTFRHSLNVIPANQIECQVHPNRIWLQQNVGRAWTYMKSIPGGRGSYRHEAVQHLEDGGHQPQPHREGESNGFTGPNKTRRGKPHWKHPLHRLAPPLFSIKTKPGDLVKPGAFGWFFWIF